MYEPYGYDEENDYISKRFQIEDDLRASRQNDVKEFEDIDDLYNKHNTEVFGNAYYDNDLESVIFENLEGNAIASIKMTDIFPSKLVKSAVYDKDTQHLIITFDNDDKIDIDLNDLINNLEAGDGLILDNAKFAVLIASDSEKFVSGTGESFLTVDASGVKISHIQEAIDVEKERALEAERVEREARIAQDNVLLGLINAEKNRAIGEETRIETKLDNEIADRNTHNNEHDAAIANLTTGLQNEVIARGNAITSVRGLITSEESARTSADASLRSLITSLENEIVSLKARVKALEDRT